MTSLLMVAALLGVGMAATLGVGDEACRGVGGTAWVADKSDCAKFFLCVEGKAHAFNCGVNVWDQNTKTCVEKGSRFDSCTSEGILENLGKPCSNGEEFSPKSDNCAQYYECSATSPLFRGEDPRLRECKYPFLWSTETKRCEYYTDVECGARKELVDPCEYRRYQCDFSHCIPCNIRFASCRGKPDGLNAWLGKESSPFFTVCSGSRVVYSGQCEQAGGVYLFDPVKRTCVEVKGNGGM